MHLKNAPSKLLCCFGQRVSRPKQSLTFRSTHNRSFRRQVFPGTGTDNSKQTRENTPKTQKVTQPTISIYNKQIQENTTHTKPLVSKPTSEKGGD